jgi:formylglycine-generating enzyme required for sulfatase activity
MASNVWEWCATRSGKDYPYDATEDEWSGAHLDRTDVRVLRGGAFDLNVVIVRAAVRSWNDPDGWGSSIGFRLVLAPIGSES